MAFLTQKSTRYIKKRKKPRKPLDIFALSSNKIQSQNYISVISDFSIAQKSYVKSAVARTHLGLKKYTIIKDLSLLIRMSFFARGDTA